MEPQLKDEVLELLLDDIKGFCDLIKKTPVMAERQALLWKLRKTLKQIDYLEEVRSMGKTGLTIHTSDIE